MKQENKTRYFIAKYEDELEKLEKKRNDYLEADKSVSRISNKIYELQDLIDILNKSKKSVDLSIENSEYTFFLDRLNNFLDEINKESQNKSEKVNQLLEFITKKLIDFEIREKE